MIDNKKIPNLGNNQKIKPSTNIYRYFFIISLVILLIIATTLCLTLVKTGKIPKSFNITQKENINNYTSSPVVIDSKNTDITGSSNDNVLIYDYVYNPDRSKETEKVLKYNIANNSIQKLQLDGYKVIDYYMTYLPSTKYIFLIKDNQIFVYDISSSKITKTSLPDLKEDKKYQDDISLISFSKDQNSVIFQINTYNKNDPGPEIGGGPEPLSSKEYVYNISENKTIASSILQKAEKLTENSNLYIIGWDNQENTLFVEYWPTSAGGYGDSVFANLNLNKNTIAKTNRTLGLRYLLSPSYKQIAIPDTSQGKIFIFDTNDLTKVKKELDISQLKTYSFSSSEIWSPNEDEIAIGFNQDIYTININSGELTLRYTDNTLGGGYLYWSRNIIAYSTSGKFLFITDRDNSNQSNLEKGLDIDKTIKIDLATNKSEVITSTNLEKESSEILSTSN